MTVATGAHPRSHEENESTAAAKGISQGSSPVSWGKLRIQSTISFDTRLIPAHSGKTTNRGARATGTRAHPRSRGENLIEDRAARGELGSSPLTRGKPWPATGVPLPRGLIPAHAGKTRST